MHKPCSILRPLLLVFLIGWLGIAAQPAEAQQTVTLSGRVTDAAGNAVSWRDRQSGKPRMGRTGDRREWQLSPLGVSRHLPPTGPTSARPAHCPKDRRAAALDEYTTRNFVLEAGVTLSGQVTASGQPVPWAWLSVVIPVIIRRSVSMLRTHPATTAWECLLEPTTLGCLVTLSWTRQ